MYLPSRARLVRRCGYSEAAARKPLGAMRVTSPIPTDICGKSRTIPAFPLSADAAAHIAGLSAEAVPGFHAGVGWGD